MNIYSFEHWRLPKYFYKYDSNSKTLVLTSRTDETKLTTTLEDLVNVKNNIPNIYPTLSNNKRVLQLQNLKFYHKVFGAGQVYISSINDNNFIEIYLCDIDRIIEDVQGLESTDNNAETTI